MSRRDKEFHAKLNYLNATGRGEEALGLHFGIDSQIEKPANLYKATDKKKRIQSRKARKRNRHKGKK